MSQDRKTGAWVAGLFIVATVTSVLAMILLDPLTGADDMLVAFAARPGTVVGSVLLMFASALAIIAIPVAIYPVLARRGAPGALLYFAARIFESVAYVIAGIFTLGMLTAARTGDAGGMRMMQDLADISFATGPTLFFSLGALVLGALLWVGRQVPRWLSGWMLVGAALMVVQGGLTLVAPLDATLETALFMPIAVNEMVFAVWLLVRGFSPDREVAVAN